MKRLLFLTVSLIAVASQAFAFNTVTVKDSISTNTTWNADQQYLLKGYVYVTSGATLTIKPGTIIRGDKATKGALIVERGAKIMAAGTADMPIIFTSNEPQGSRTYGDWGGVIICGKAPVNWTAGEAQVEGGPRSFYGGTDANDNSGVLSYVRIEFGGIAFSPNNEVNSLTLCGVGAGTQIDHIMVSYGGDDGIEWFGGTVNAKYLVSHRMVDDDFDNDNGYNGKVQFFVSQKDPNVADISGSKAIESDSYLAGTVDGKTDASKATKAVFSNGTMIGPVVTPTSTAYDVAQHTAGVHIRRGSSLSLFNSIIGGFACGLLIDESSSSYGSTTKNIGSGSMEFKSNIIAGTSTTGIPSGAPNKNIVFVVNGARSLTPTSANADSATSGNTDWTPYSGPFAYLQDAASGNFQYASMTSQLALWNPFDEINPNFFPKSSSPVIYNSRALPSYIPAGTFPGNVYPFDCSKAINTDTSNKFANYNAPTVVPNFASSKVNDPFFTKTSYVGAFGCAGDNWMSKWTNFDPNNTYYETVVSVENIEENIEATSVYPNPATTNAYVNIALKQNTDVNIYLVDMTGRVVKNIFAGKTSGSQTYNVDLADVNAGMYFVTVASANGQKTVKLTVIK
ncbi:MAG TPA: T9SS type A sorting domain-containing protein [Flavipsychrobacter sp.]|nr:T9SS type A sorting domain-containing protein [Flavipsychrobacter sp.]